jgi:hypothetical protein
MPRGCSLHPNRRPVAATIKRRLAPNDLGEFLIRFIIGGLFVSAFAVLGDVLKPKSIAGLFGATPSSALATLILTILKEAIGSRGGGALDGSGGGRVFRLRLHRLPNHYALKLPASIVSIGSVSHLARCRVWSGGDARRMNHPLRPPQPNENQVV